MLPRPSRCLLLVASQVFQKVLQRITLDGFAAALSPVFFLIARFFQVQGVWNTLGIGGWTSLSKLTEVHLIKLELQQLIVPLVIKEPAGWAVLLTTAFTCLKEG